MLSGVFFFNDTATTEIYTLSLHDALPISGHTFSTMRWSAAPATGVTPTSRIAAPNSPDRKSTRLNSSHSQISYAVFCLKKKKLKGNFVWFDRKNAFDARRFIVAAHRVLHL